MEWDYPKRLHREQLQSRRLVELKSPARIGRLDVGKIRPDLCGFRLFR
jgi:hypothetical protein